MGFSLNFLPFFDKCHAVHPFASPFLSLGSQEIHDTTEIIDVFFRRNAYKRAAHHGHFEALLRERYAVSDYADNDINGLASFNWDLSRPLPAKLHSKWGVIYDGGTLEHIFNIAQAFENIHNLCAVGGTVIHVTPVSWQNHGFYNLTPKLFYSLCSANKYKPVASAWHVSPQAARSEPRGFFRKLFSSRYALHTANGLVITKEALPPALFTVPDCLVCNGYFPQNALYCIAYRKTSTDAFVTPCDIAY